MTEIDISGLSKAEVLAALYNVAKPLGMGYLQYTPEDMTIELAEKEIESRVSSVMEIYKNVPNFTREDALKRCVKFDYLHGRLMKVNISGDTFDPTWFDRDNGAGSAKREIDNLRKIKG